MKAIKMFLIFVAMFMVSSVGLATYDTTKQAYSQTDSVYSSNEVIVDSVALYDLYGDILRVNTLQRIDYLQYSCGEFKGSDNLLDPCYRARISKKWVHQYAK